MSYTIRVLLLLFLTSAILYFMILKNFYSMNITISWKNVVEERSNFATVASNDITEQIFANITCFTGVVFARTGMGRLGNRLMEYASTWSLGMLYNLTPVVEDDLYSRITPLFPKLSVPRASTFIAELRERDPACAELAHGALVNGMSTPVETITDEKIKEMKSREPIILKECVVFAEAISRMHTSMKKEFNHAPKYDSYAERTLRRAGAGLKSTAGQVVYVGVHVRRTDYIMFLAKKLMKKSGDIADTNYFVRAVKFMLKYLSKAGNSKVVFALASDDKKWTTETLIPTLEKYIESNTSLGKNVIVSWCGSKDPLKDLVLLSSCNHSIISYGTYGTWSALMAGGRTIVFDTEFGEKKTVINPTVTFARILPNWTALHGHSVYI